jgi:hypothetical protein
LKVNLVRSSKRLFSSPCLYTLAALLLLAASTSAQISPNEIRDPDLKALEKQYFQELKTLNQNIAHMHFPFTFYLSRYVGLEPSKQAEADSRGLEFVKFRDRSVLKVTGNYNAAYNANTFTRNERAARTVQDVILPILRTVTQGISPDVGCDAIGFEISYHTRADEKSYDYEGKETLVIVVDKQDSFKLAQATNDQARQDILNQSQIFLGGKEYGLSLLEKDPLLVESLPKRATPPQGSTTLPASLTAASHSSAPLVRSSSSGLTYPSSESAISPKPDLSQSKPATKPEDVEKLEAEYKTQLDALANEGKAKFQFVDYDPPAFVVVNKEMALQMTLRNALHFDAEKTSIYKRAAQTFDLFLAPKLKDILASVPRDANFDFYDFSVVNLFSTLPGAKERSEAVEFVLPKNLAQQFADSEITNQALIDKSQVLINGVRIALNLQLVE